MLNSAESPTGFHALYWTHDDFMASKPAFKTPVVDWDEEGEPRVLDDHGRRVIAASLPDFHSVTQTLRIVAALPGGGWSVVWRMLPEDDQEIGAPVISWVVYSNGELRPVADVIGGGHLQPLDLTDGDIKLIPPTGDGSADPTIRPNDGTANPPKEDR
ncbi:hypothetical protein [Streptomyces sp. H27-C3]|uniref:hypothetical protein n=1 Tax=Streptomyces sp. H27-C3 TaxID=3046305 RepID=UPI0024BB7E15|nr:hypothetical protein [Streptomyces sp. H27-C3]MDJ0461582.1 hypothetical protein [Streptomyces sp. H27-C3]